MTSMSNPNRLDLTISQAQNNMALTNMSNLKYLDLIVSQVQSNMDLKNMPNPKNSDIINFQGFMFDPKQSSIIQVLKT